VVPCQNNHHAFYEAARRPGRRSQAPHGTSSVAMSNDISSLLQQTIRRTTHDIVAKDNTRRVAATASVAPQCAAADCASGRLKVRWTCGAANSAWVVRSTAGLCRVAHIRFSGTRNMHRALSAHANVSSHRVEVSLVCRPVCGARAVGCFFRGSGWLSAAGLRLAPPCGQPQ
jgi:hypothetical protein